MAAQEVEVETAKEEELAAEVVTEVMVGAVPVAPLRSRAMLSLALIIFQRPADPVAFQGPEDAISLQGSL